MGQSMLQAVSYLAPNWFGFYTAVTEALARSLSIDIQLRQGDCDPLDDPMLLNDQLDLAFLCGLPFIRHHRVAPHQLQVLAAPVMQAERYGDRPLYFSDVIVKATSPVQRFSDLAGQRFCYNDPGSNSGCNLVYWHVLQQGDRADFFGERLQSGAHQRSIQWILDERADWAAIDSTVLERELEIHPPYRTQLRVIAAIGPTPMPPIVAATHLGTALIQQLRLALLHPDTDLQTAMRATGVQRYARLDGSDYIVLADRYDAVLAGGLA